MSRENFVWLLYSAIGFLASTVFTLIVYRIAPSIRLIDMPNDRSSHAMPTPRGGGVGIWVIAVVAVGIMTKSIVFTFLVGFVGGVGILEDIFHLPVKIRLLLYLILSSVAVLMFFDFPAPYIISAILFLFWTIFIAGTLNIYNFMDGIDGIAGITGIVGFGLMGCTSQVIFNETQVALISILLAAACLGFLIFNFPKAKIFMGDVGSVLLGFMFAVMVLILSKTFLDFVCLSSFLFMFYADEAITCCLRLKSKENLLRAHRGHFYQILSNDRGIPHWKVSVLYGVCQLIVGFGVLRLRPFGLSAVLIFVVTCFVLYMFANYLVRKDS